jgi:hypothetical protein
MFLSNVCLCISLVRVYFCLFFGGVSSGVFPLSYGYIGYRCLSVIMFKVSLSMGVGGVFPWAYGVMCYVCVPILAHAERENTLPPWWFRFKVPANF